MTLVKSNNLKALPIPHAYCLFGPWREQGGAEHRRGTTLPNKYINRHINKQSIRPLPDMAETAPEALEDESSFFSFSLFSAVCID